MAIGVAPAGGADTRGGSSAPKLLEKTIAAPHPIVTSAGAITHSPTARCQLYMRASVDRGDRGRSAVRHWPRADRKSVVWGKSVSVRVDLGGRRRIQKKKTDIQQVTSTSTETLNKE